MGVSISRIPDAIQIIIFIQYVPYRTDTTRTQPPSKHLALVLYCTIDPR
jgi:hypothetical protein